MQKNVQTVQGYCFESTEELIKAKKEQEAITYIRSRMVMSNTKKVLRLYMKLVKKNIFETVVGYDFLVELRNVLLKSEEIPSGYIPPVPIKEKKKENEEQNLKTDCYEKENERRIRLEIITVFLVVIIIAMFIITYVGNYRNLDRMRTQVENEYAEWKEELTKKEDELREREQIILEKESNPK